MCLYKLRNEVCTTVNIYRIPSGKMALKEISNKCN